MHANFHHNLTNNNDFFGVRSPYGEQDCAVSGLFGVLTFRRATLRQPINRPVDEILSGG